MKQSRENAESVDVPAKFQKNNMSNKRKLPWTAKRIRNVIDHIHNEQFAMMKRTIHLRAFSSFYRHNDELGNDLRFVTAIVKSSDDNLLLKTEREIREAYIQLTEANDDPPTEDPSREERGGEQTLSHTRRGQVAYA